MYRLKLLCATLLTHWLLVRGAFAVVVDINIQTEGDPVPQAEISFQTLDGDPIDLALFEEETEQQEPAQPAAATPAQPATTPSETPPAANMRTLQAER